MDRTKLREEIENQKAAVLPLVNAEIERLRALGVQVATALVAFTAFNLERIVLPIQLRLGPDGPTVEKR